MCPGQALALYFNFSSPYNDNFLILTARIKLSCQGKNTNFSFVFVFVMHDSFYFFKSLNFFFRRLVWPPVRLHNPETNARGTKIKADLL